MSTPRLFAHKADFERAIARWSDELLRPYVERLERNAAEPEERRPIRRGKEFNDAVWRTIILQPFEVLIVDSPLIQRLRRIRQLGVVHLVYPSAIHTRFEHTLGATLQVSRLTDSLMAEPPPNNPTLTPAWRNLLRLAALCHDIGHGAMSHVSENALRNNSEVEDVRFEFSDEFQSAEIPSLSEIAAYYMVGSSLFGRLLSAAKSLVPSHELPESTQTKIQRSIIGLGINDEIPLLHELISGPFDGDKLDYMTRDAMMTGVPVVTDVDRLIQKVRAVRVGPSALPLEIASEVREGPPSYVLTGISLSGGRTLDELLIGKALHRDKLYRHQKVRSAEAMVAAIFQQLGEITTCPPALLGYRLADEDILRLDDEAFVRLGLKKDASSTTLEARVALDISRRLGNRELFVRAYAFAQNMPLDPYRSEAEHWRGLTLLSLAANSPTSRGELVREIADEISTILSALGRGELLDGLPDNDLMPYLWIDPPQPPEEDDENSARAYLIGDNGDWLRFRDDFAEAIGWSAAYPLTRDLGYLFSTAEVAPYAHLAMARVVREKFEVKTPASMLPYAKQVPEQIEAIKGELARTGYYDGLAYDLHPIPDRLTMADVKPRIDELVKRLAGYEGPVREGHLGKQASLMNDERARNWVSQFESNDLIDAAMRALDHVRMIGRQELASSLRNFLQSNPEFRDGSLVPLGEPKDSSSVLTYYAGDVGGAFGLVGRTLGDALAEEGPIVFVDDFIGTGRQAVSIVESWVGQRTIDLREERPPPLPDEMIAVLKSRRLGFALSAGTSTGVECLRKRCAELELNAAVAAGLMDFPSIGDDIFASDDQRVAFTTRCTEIGLALLRDDSVGHDEEWCAKRALGYGNQGLLIVFPYNTPTATLTALWARGEIDGVQWEPLVPRRPKR